MIWRMWRLNQRSNQAHSLYNCVQPIAFSYASFFGLVLFLAHVYAVLFYRSDYNIYYNIYDISIFNTVEYSTSYAAFIAIVNRLNTILIKNFPTSQIDAFSTWQSSFNLLLIILFAVKLNLFLWL